MRRLFQILLISTAIYFISWAAVYLTGVNGLPIQSEDTVPAMFIPVTIVKEGTIYADTYYEMIRNRYPHPDDKDYKKDLTPFYFRKVGEHYISAFPLVSGLLALPVFAGPLLFGMEVSWDNLIYLSHLTSAIISALCGAVLYLLLKKHFFKDEKKAILLTTVYLFGTINFAQVSQSLWQHGALQLFLLLSFYLIYEKKWMYAGLSLGLALLSRPTALFLAPFVILFFLSKLFDGEKSFKDQKIDRGKLKRTGLYVLGLLITGAFFFWYTKKYYLGIQNNGYADQLFVNWRSRFPEGFLGLWLSPSKGILVYSPLFIFSGVGLWQILKNRNYKRESNFIYLISAGMVLTHTLILGKWKHWYGGWSFGYRMAADIIPFLVLLIAPFIKSEFFNKYKKVFIGLLVLSIAVEVYGLIFFDGIWHAAYDRGFTDTGWLWSLKDSELVFNIRRILVKLGRLEKACPSCL